MTHDAPIASIAIPAYNESAVISRCLSSLLESALPGELEVVVACNGCTDDTARIAASYDGVTVVEVDRASKIAALNAADDALTAFPRFYLDADVEVTTESVRTLIGEMSTLGALCGAPRPDFETVGRSWLIRSFYAVWARQPYLRQQPVGNGVYVLTAEGRKRFGRFPQVVSDDLFVRNSFHITERYCSPDVSFTIHTPRTLRGLMKMRVRVHRGNAELTAADPRTDAQHGRRIKSLLDQADNLGAVAQVGVFVGVNVVARALARLKRYAGRHTWERDESARELEAGS